MARSSFKRHRLDVIRQSVWLPYRFSLSLRDVEEILAGRGVDVSCEEWMLTEPTVSIRPVLEYLSIGRGKLAPVRIGSQVRLNA